MNKDFNSLSEKDGLYESKDAYRSEKKPRSGDEMPMNGSADETDALLQQAYLRVQSSFAAYSEFNTFLTSLTGAIIKEEKNSKYSFTKGDSSRLELSKAAAHDNARYQLRREKMLPKIHAYIREHGMPDVFPTDFHYYASFTLENKDSTLSCRSIRIAVPFFLMGGDFPSSTSDEFVFHEREASGSDEAKSFLKCRPRKTNYVPDGVYDQRFAEMDKKIRQYTAEARKLESAVETEKSCISANSGGLFPGLLYFPFKLLFAMLVVGLSMLPMFIGATIVVWIISIFLRDGMLKTLLGVAWLMGTAGYFLYCLWECRDDIELFSCFEKMHQKQVHKKELQKAKAAYAKRYHKLMQKAEALKNSAEYREASANDKRLRAEDQALAARWQEEWYRQQCNEKHYAMLE